LNIFFFFFFFFSFDRSHLCLLLLCLQLFLQQIAYERLLNVNRRVWILPLRFAYKMSIDVSCEFFHFSLFSFHFF